MRARRLGPLALLLGLRPSWSARLSTAALEEKHDLDAKASKCPAFERSNRFACDHGPGTIGCRTGGCPLDGKDLRPNEQRPNGWMVRVEPCDFDTYPYNPAWSGLHITMTSIQHYDNPVAKFEKLQLMLEAKKFNKPWAPTDTAFTREDKTKQCGEPGHWASVDIRSDFLEEVGNMLQSVGFKDKPGVKHVTLAYPAGWQIPEEGYLLDKEYQSITTKMKRARWRLVLLHMNAATQTIEKHGGFDLMYDGAREEQRSRFKSSVTVLKKGMSRFKK